MKARRSPQRRRSRAAILYLAPALGFYLVFVIAPWLNTAWYSLFEWDGIGEATWVGLANYVTVFTNPDHLQSIGNALGLIVFFCIFPIIIGLVLAALSSQGRKGNWAAVRTLVFLPQVLPLVAVGITWKWMYQDDGLVNQVLRLLGAGAVTRNWLGDFDFAFIALGLVGTWVGTGLCMVLFVAGIQKIDQQLYEAVRLDGGGRIREFFVVTLPGLRGEITVAATVTIISALASFDVVFVMTLGGPGTATMVPGVEIYNLAFSYNQVGLACALGIVLSLLIYTVVILINVLSREREESE